jgi:hypothetical protein
MHFSDPSIDRRPHGVDPSSYRGYPALHSQVRMHEHLHVHSERPGVRWRKSTASNPSGNCVELAELPGGDIAVRNSRSPDGPVLVCTRAEIGAFLAGVQAGEFDDLDPRYGWPA